LALLVPLPEREVARVLLQRALLLFLRWVADRLLVEAAGQDAVVGVAVDAVVDVAAGGICEVPPAPLPDQCDDLGHGLGPLRLVIGPAHAEIRRVLDVPPGSVRRELRAVPRRGGG